MTKELIIKIVKKICGEKYDLDVIESAVSNSLYFSIKGEFATTYFRISDHDTWRHVRSMTLKKNTKQASVERYVRNSIKIFEKRSVLGALKQIERGNESCSAQVA